MMKKRVLCAGMAFVILLVCLLGMGPVPVKAETPTSGECGESVQWNFDADTGTLTISGTGAMRNDYSDIYSIPWYAYKDDIQKIVIQQGVTVIGASTFKGTRVKIVEIAASVERIEVFAFAYCAFLNEIHFKGDAPTIQQLAFTQVTATAFYPASNPTWTTGKEQNLMHSNLSWCADDGNGAQISDVHGDVKWELKGDTLYIEPNDGVKSTYMQPQPAWLDYKGVIKKVVMTGEIEVIGIGAFKDCSELTEVQWPTGVTIIGMETFMGCTSLETLTIPNTVKHISVSAFSYCRGLKTLNLPESLSEVDLNAFKGCSSLQSITFPACVVDIKGGAFRGCTSLKSIYFTGSMPKFAAHETSPNIVLRPGVIQPASTEPGTFTGIDSAVTVYYLENAAGWTEDALEYLNIQYEGQNVTFASYRQETEEPEQTPAETTGSADQEQPEQNAPQTNLESTGPDNSPATGESQTPSSNGDETNPETQQTASGDVKEEPVEEKNGTKWWIPAVIVAVVAAGAFAVSLLLKKKK